MTVLILHRASLSDHPYDLWLKDLDGGAILLASNEKLHTFGEDLPLPGGFYRHIEGFSGYDTSNELVVRCLELARSTAITHVLATAEFDLERAAAIRTQLSLPGQTPRSAQAFRDKPLMRHLLREAGMKVPDWRVIDCGADLYGFAAGHDFPLVVKPRNGAASVDVRVLGSSAELRSFLAESGSLLVPPPPYRPNFMVEEFVEGTLYHVDGLVLEGRSFGCWPSRYLAAQWPYADRPFDGDVMLDAADPLTGRLIACAEEVLEALPTPEICAFHAEIFHTPDDQLVVCEIASRSSGGLVPHMLFAAFGTELEECSLRAQVGLPLSPEAHAWTQPPPRTAALLHIPPTPGRVAALPGPAPFAWVVEAILRTEVGAVMHEAKSAADFIASYVVVGDTTATCTERLAELHDWFREGFSVR